MSPAVGHKEEQGLGALVLQGEAERAGNMQLEEDKVAHQACGVYIVGDTKNSAGQSPGQPLLADAALCKGLDQMNSRDAF